MSAFDPEPITSSSHKRPGAPPSMAEAPVTLQWQEPSLSQRPKPASKVPIVLASVMTLSAAGLGYMSWQLWTAHKTASARLAVATDQVEGLSQERKQNRAQLDELRQKSASDKERIDADAAQITELKATLGAAQASLQELKAEQQALNARVAEFRSVAKQFQRMIDSGKLQISFRRGRMIVELPAAVLFASGSAALSDDGKKSLQEVAKILRTVPGKRFIVGGHTDDVPIAKPSGEFSSNWALSAARAVTVTEALVDAGLRANQLVAAGFSAFDPVAANANDRGRQKNRRIEIVLEPVLAELPDAVKDLTKPAAAKPAAAKK